MGFSHVSASTFTKLCLLTLVNSFWIIDSHRLSNPRLVILGSSPFGSKQNLLSVRFLINYHSLTLDFYRPYLMNISCRCTKRFSSSCVRPSCLRLCFLSHTSHMFKVRSGIFWVSSFHHRSHLCSRAVVVVKCESYVILEKKNMAQYRIAQILNTVVSSSQKLGSKRKKEQ